MIDGQSQVIISDQATRPRSSPCFGGLFLLRLKLGISHTGVSFRSFPWSTLTSAPRTVRQSVAGFPVEIRERVRADPQLPSLSNGGHDIRSLQFFSALCVLTEMKGIASKSVRWLPPTPRS
jgi:hypothetical protein